jgi:hypothetical protein
VQRPWCRPRPTFAARHNSPPIPSRQALACSAAPTAATWSCSLTARNLGQVARTWPLACMPRCAVCDGVVQGVSSPTSVLQRYVMSLYHPPLPPPIASHPHPQVLSPLATTAACTFEAPATEAGWRVAFGYDTGLPLLQRLPACHVTSYVSLQAWCASWRAT